MSREPNNSAPCFSTLVKLARHRALNQADRLAYTFLLDGEAEEATLTYRELDAKARLVAALLQEIRAVGGRALLLYPPGLDYISAFFGCLYAGVVAVPAYPPRRNRSLSRFESIVADAGATVVLATTSVLRHVARQFRDSPVLKTLHWVTTDDIPGEAAEGWRETELSGDDLALLQYTSGSTGQPKGVMLSHGNLLHNLSLINSFFGNTPDSSGLIWLPPYHDMGLIGGVLQPLFAGHPVTLMLPAAFLQRPLRWLQAISRTKATHSGGPNFAYDLCIRKTTPDERARLDLSSWTLAFNGAEQVRLQTLEQFAEVFEPCGFRREAFFPCYGLAEATLIVTGGAKGKFPLTCTVDEAALEHNHVVITESARRTRTFVSCGKPAPGHSVKIVAPESPTPYSSSEIGEIWVSGPSVAQGYWGRPEETAQTFRASLTGTGEGSFLRTGDLGFLNDNGLFITGRLKDLIILRGCNYYPQDIERSVEQSHPSLRQGSAVTFSVEVAGEERLAIVVELPRHFKGSGIDEIIRAIRQAVAEEHEVGASVVVFVKPGTIPHTSSGKIQRFACKTAFLTGALEIVGEWKQGAIVDQDVDGERSGPPADVPPSQRTSRNIRDWLAARVAARAGIKLEALDVRKSLMSYGLDSVAAVQISAELEYWLGRRLSPTLAYEYPSIEALAKYLAGERVFAAHTPDGVKAPESRQEAVAIIGIGCRFPGAPNPDAFWQLLRGGVDAVTEVPAERWDWRQFYDLNLKTPDKMNTRWGGFIENPDQFDPHFFGISPLEAESMDPQQRLLLEVSWEALEDAGQSARHLAGTRAGVFIGISTNDYSRLQTGARSSGDPFWSTSNALSIAANRLSYCFNLRGPSIAIDTACSSSLVAVHLACRSLVHGESTLALAGGVNLILSPEITISFSQAGATSPEGRCKAFDARANGIVRGEGVGIVVLKPLSQALSDGDHVYAIIRGSAISQDGSTNGMTAPSRLAQEAVLREAYRMSGISPGRVQYIEAHGAGTLLGDPIEAKALGSVLGTDRPDGQPCAIGSVKTNIGHLEAAAGIASLIKVALSLTHREIPPSLHLREPNPYINFEELRLRVQRELAPWPDPARTAVAGVSAFGFGGTNAHLVIEEPPPETTNRLTQGLAEDDKQAHLLALSARDPETLRALAQSYRNFLDTEGFGPAPSWRDVCFTASVRRSHHDHRLALVFKSKEELRQRLEAFMQGKTQPGTNNGRLRQGQSGGIVFVFSGYGSQWRGMGRQLLAQEAVFRAALAQCDELLRSHVSWSVLEELTLDETGSEASADHGKSQTSLFAVQVALSALWHSWGIRPSAVVGHSMGEVAAAYVAGALSLPDAIRVIVSRSALLEQKIRQADQRGAMGMVRLSAKEVQALLSEYDGRLSIAAQNSPTLTILSGDAAALDELFVKMKARKVAYRLMRLPGAGHSRELKSAGKELELELEGIEPRAASVRIFSTVSGQASDGLNFDARYWGRNVSEPVLFSTAIESLILEGHNIFLEVSPDPTLSSSVSDCLAHHGQELNVFPSLRRNCEERSVMLGSLGSLYKLGLAVEWERLYPEGGRRVRLPLYPWQRQRYWKKPEAVSVNGDGARAWDKPESAGRHPFLRRQLEAAPSGARYFEAELDAHRLPYLNDHRVQGATLLSSAAYIEMALAAVAAVFGDRPFELAEVEFLRPLFLPASTTRTIQVVLFEDEAVPKSFRVYSRIRQNGRDAGDWILHARGRVNTVPDAEAKQGAGRLSREEIRDRCPETLSSDEFYRALAGAGAEYGRTFRGVEQLWRGGPEALGQLNIPQEVEQEAAAYQLHPAILDACLQVLAATAPITTVTDGQEETYLPMAAKRVRLYGRPARRLWSYARRRTDDGLRAGVFEGDVHIMDESGEPVADVTGFCVQHLDSNASRSLNDWVYELYWEPKEREEPPAASAARNHAPSRWLVFTDSSGVGESLVERMNAAGEECLVVSRGDVFHQSDECYFQIRPTHAEDMRRLVAAVVEKEGRTLSGCVHLWSLDHPSPSEMSVASLEASLVSTCGSVLRLLREITCAESTPERLPLWLVTRGAQPVCENSTPLSIAQTPLWGLGRTIAQEHPNLWGGLIDLDSGASSDESASLLWNEILNHNQEEQLAFRNGQRFVARLIPKREESASTNLLRLRPDATYLITGGLGDLGLVVARWMVEKGARRLILLGHTPLPARNLWSTAEQDSRLAEQIKTIRELEASGTSVHLAQVDVADEAQVNAYLESYARELWPPIKGVMHLAGSVHGQALLEMDDDALITDFRPKAIGCWLLHKHFDERELDFFILFSSGAALLSSPFLGAYAASNVFLDAMAHYRRMIGQTALSINWGFWAEAGMAVRQMREYGRDYAPRGMKGFTNEQGLEMLERLLRQDSTQAAVMPFDWNEWHKYHPAAASSSLLSRVVSLVDGSPVPGVEGGGELSRSLILSARPEKRQKLLEFEISKHLAGVLRVPASSLDVQEPLSNIGLDSLMAVELKNRLEVGLGVALPMVKLLQGPSIAQVTTLLLEQLNGHPPEPAAPVPGEAESPLDALEHAVSVEGHGNEEFIPNIDQLSDQEVDALLHALLDEESRTDE
jgi:phthiocerol/phenolphthiocerol synthesis type-I polyketide synthase C